MGINFINEWKIYRLITLKQYQKALTRYSRCFYRVKITLIKFLKLPPCVIISSSENWFYNTVDFVLVKPINTLMKREITIISFVFVLWMHYLLNFVFVFFFKFVSRLFSFSLIHTDIIHLSLIHTDTIAIVLVSYC